jgi:Phosphodiester glycosidase
MKKLLKKLFAIIAISVASASLFAQSTPSFTLPTTTAAPTTINGLWWNPAESGWGVTFTQQANIIFVTLFTYDSAGQARWYVASDCRVAGNGCTGDFYSVIGGSQPVGPWAPNLQVTRVGLFSASFADVNNGNVSYSINGVNGSKTVTRQLWGASSTPTSGIAWDKAADLNTNMPNGIAVFRGTGNGLRAWYATLDASVNPNIEWNVASIAPGSRTPLEFANAESKPVYVTINAGYFGASSINQSFSLAIKNGVTAATGVKQLTRNGQIYYPTRAAFGAMANGDIVATWAYPVGASNTITQYPLPSPNDSSKPPLALPDANFPAGGSTWSPVKAIGGGPILIKNGAKIVTFTEEIFDAASGISPTGAAPRTAVAKLAYGKVLFIVIDGRSSISRGVTLSELADILLSLGATEAINLDGGGSSAMVVNGALANTPSDGAMRSVPTALLFRDK